MRARTAELDASLGARDLLLKEVNHRVKNNLQLVSSMLSLHGRETQSEAARVTLAQARLRVLAIADLHDKPYRSDNPDMVELGTYLDQVCDDLRSSIALGEGRRLEVRTVPFIAPTDLALPLALAVAELVTNAQRLCLRPGRAGRHHGGTRLPRHRPRRLGRGFGSGRDRERAQRLRQRAHRSLGAADRWSHRTPFGS